jgi:hypothetical protein
MRRTAIAIAIATLGLTASPARADDDATPTESATPAVVVIEAPDEMIGARGYGKGL